MNMTSCSDYEDVHLPVYYVIVCFLKLHFVLTTSNCHMHDDVMDRQFTPQNVCMIEKQHCPEYLNEYLLRSHQVCMMTSLKMTSSCTLGLVCIHHDLSKVAH